MRRRGVLLAFAAALSAAAPALALPSSSARAGCASVPLQFSAPVPLRDGLAGLARGFEPGIEIDSSGTIFVTAKKWAHVQGGGQQRSFLWRSEDGGRTFSSMTGLSGAPVSPTGEEGDLAIDGRDRLYFVDMNIVDSHLYRYGDHGRSLDLYRPAVMTAAVDDRPWIAAHGDGYVYYMSSRVLGTTGRLTVHRSTDAGESFDPIGFNFPGSSTGFIDADPNSAHVYAVVTGGASTSPGEHNLSVQAWRSADRGLTWSMVELASKVTAEPFTGVSVSPTDGSVYAYWNMGTKLMLSRSADRGQTWLTYDATPFEGTFSNQWAAAGPDGTVGMVFYGKARGESQPHLYGMAWRERGTCAGSTRCTGPASSVGRLEPGPALPQEHFFQVDVSKDGALNVAYADPNINLYFVRQSAGPNLRSRSWCGRHGRP